MKIRLYNARILTMEENKDIFRGEILDGMNSVYNPVNEEKPRAPKRRGRGNRRNSDRG